jgi:hypothetical protein
MRSIKPYVNINTMKSIYYSYFHAVMTYGLVFWGNSPDSIKIFRLQKKIIRIMMGSRNRLMQKTIHIPKNLTPPFSIYSFLALVYDKKQVQISDEF